MTETETNENDTEILARMNDPIEAGKLRALLEAEGIAVSTPGLHHRQILAFNGPYIDVVVRVPKSDLERAKTLLAVYEDHSHEAPDADPPKTDRIRRVAAFAAIGIPFGGGHFYARRWSVGFFFLALQLVAIACALAWPLFWYAVLSIALVDAAGAVSLVGSDQRGEAPSKAARAAPLFAIAVLLLVPAMRVLTPRLLAGPAMTQACARAAECGGGEDVDRCVAAAAQRTFEGDGSRDLDRACAACLDESLCEDIPFECHECDGLVHLPAATSPAAHAPAGAGADELLHVVPSLFPREQTAPPSPEVDDMLRLLEASTPPSSPARP